MTGPLLKRLWIYQAERFPLAKTVPLLAVFSAASLNVSALLAGRELPGALAYGVAAVLALGLFFQMRVCDEVKDLEDDTRYRPERPIPRGLVSLGTIVWLGVAVAAAMLTLAALWSGGTLLLLLVVWGWLGLMTLEFGVPSWLKARPMLYLLSHMAIMPLIDLLLTGIEWTVAGPPSGWLWLFLALSFVNGCVLEIGRKVWAPESERDGVETYSALWGPRRAVQVWLGTVVLAFGLLVLLGTVMGHAGAFALVGALGLLAVGGSAAGFLRTSTPRWQGRVDAMAGVWVLICYATAGFLPLVLEG